MAGNFPSRKTEPITLQTELFDGASEDCEYAVVLTAHSGSNHDHGVILPAEDVAATHLVQGAYVETGIISGSEQDLRQIESLRGGAERYAVLHNLGEGLAELFATCKLIHRGTEEDPRLPIESYFPNLFHPEDTVGCLEISQVVSRHPNEFTQQLGFFALLRVAYGYAISDQDLFNSSSHSPKVQVTNRAIEEFLRLEVPGQTLYEPFVREILCVTEDGIIEYVRGTDGPNIPVTRLNQREEPAFVQEARIGETALHAASFDVAEITKLYKEGKNPLLDLFLERAEHHQGLGLFDMTMANHVGDTPLHLL